MSKFEDEYKKVSDTSIKLVCTHLMNRDDLRSKLNNPKKSIDGMWAYIVSQAKKKAINNCAACSVSEVYGWAVHYYDEEVIEGDSVQPSRLNLESAKAIVKKSVEKKPKKEESEWKQESLF